MSLTTAQKVSLNTAIRATALNLEDYGAIADWLNAATTHVAWKSSLSSIDARKAIVSGDQLGQLDNLTVGKRDALLYALSDNLDTDVAAVRIAIEGLCGTQNTLKAALTAAMKRVTNNAEKILSTGTGTDASPASLGWEGTVSIYEIGEILAAV
jgi:hypothetical protein